MKRRYILAPEAARDLVSIWKYLKAENGESVADRVESVIREKLVFLADHPGAGHTRQHGHRDIGSILGQRL
jgi:plasmid stabilization system protein ParE